MEIFNSVIPGLDPGIQRHLPRIKVNGLDARLRGHDDETIVVVVSGAIAKRWS